MNLNNPGMVINSGLITAAVSIAGLYGVRMANGGTVLNNAGATIQGHMGVVLGNGAASPTPAR